MRLNACRRNSVRIGLGLALCLGLGLASWGVVWAKSGGKLWHKRPSAKAAPKIVAYDFSNLVKRVRPAVFNLEVTSGRSYYSSRRSRRPRYRRRPRGGSPWDWFQGPPSMPRHRRYMPLRRSRGSGFLINAKGYALTNHHVVRRAGRIKAQLADGREFEVKVIGKSPLLDIALIKLISKKNTTFPFVYLGNSSKMLVGEPVVAIGNARGLGISVTAGIISAKGRVLQRSRGGQQSYDNYIQTDAAINKGNSGGPLFNRHGEVIGINTAILRGGRGIGFAVPINVVQRILPQLSKKGRVERAKLGVMIQAVTPSLARSFGMPRAYGALVSRVVPGSPAASAGIHQGDIILEFNGQKVERSTQLPLMVAFNPPGTKAKIVVLRRGKRLSLSVTLLRWGRSFEDVPSHIGKRPPVATRKTPNAAPSSTKALQRLGVGIGTVPAELRTQWKLPAKGGILVTSVKAGSPAAENGLRRGDVILEINRVAMNSPKDFFSQVSKIPAGDNILLLIRRNASSLFLAFPLR